MEFVPRSTWLLKEMKLTFWLLCIMFYLMFLSSELIFLHIFGRSIQEYDVRCFFFGIFDLPTYYLRSLMGNVIETVRSTCSDYWAAYVALVEKKSKQTDLNDTPEPMSLPIND